MIFMLYQTPDGIVCACMIICFMYLAPKLHSSQLWCQHLLGRISAASHWCRLSTAGMQFDDKTATETTHSQAGPSCILPRLKNIRIHVDIVTSNDLPQNIPPVLHCILRLITIRKRQGPHYISIGSGSRPTICVRFAAKQAIT